MKTNTSTSRTPGPPSVLAWIVMLALPLATPWAFAATTVAGGGSGDSESMDGVGSSAEPVPADGSANGSTGAGEPTGPELAVAGRAGSPEIALGDALSGSFFGSPFVFGSIVREEPGARSDPEAPDADALGAVRLAPAPAWISSSLETPWDHWESREDDPSREDLDEVWSR